MEILSIDTSCCVTCGADITDEAVAISLNGHRVVCCGLCGAPNEVGVPYAFAPAADSW